MQKFILMSSSPETDAEAEAEAASSSAPNADLHPIGHYLDDREEMIDQVFSVIRGAKLRAMLTSTLRDLRLDELKALCLQELEGMSRRRIRAVLRGEEMEESSNTEDDDEEDKEVEGDPEKDGEVVRKKVLPGHPQGGDGGRFRVATEAQE